MGTGHDHGASAGGAHRGRLVIVLAITTAVLIVEVIGGLISGSLALFADAGHMFTDVAGLALAVFAVTFSRRRPTARRSYGYYRLEILAAVVNAVLLIGVAVFVLVEAGRRFRHTPSLDAGEMLVFGSIGLLANLISLGILRAGAEHSLNVKGAYLEVLGDLFGSAAVIVAAAVVLGTEWRAADPLASVAVALLILPRTWLLLREAVDVLLEATPKGIDLEAIHRHIVETEGVVDAHDLHVWTITSGMPVLSVHVVVTDAALDDGGGGRVLDRLSHCLAEHFDVEHCTFQLEPVGHAGHELGSH
jgi:cobalt-zinc-cadmium efflux system protein